MPVTRFEIGIVNAEKHLLNSASTSSLWIGCFDGRRGDTGTWMNNLGYFFWCMRRDMTLSDVTQKASWHSNITLRGNRTCRGIENHS